MIKSKMYQDMLKLVKKLKFWRKLKKMINKLKILYFNITGLNLWTFKEIIRTKNSNILLNFQ